MRPHLCKDVGCDSLTLRKLCSYCNPDSREASFSSTLISSHCHRPLLTLCPWLPNSPAENRCLVPQSEQSMVLSVGILGGRCTPISVAENLAPSLTRCRKLSMSCPRLFPQCSSTARFLLSPSPPVTQGSLRGKVPQALVDVAPPPFRHLRPHNPPVFSRRPESMSARQCNSLMYCLCSTKEARPFHAPAAGELGAERPKPRHLAFVSPKPQLWEETTPAKRRRVTGGGGFDSWAGVQGGGPGH